MPFHFFTYSNSVCDLKGSTDLWMFRETSLQLQTSEGIFLLESDFLSDFLSESDFLCFLLCLSFFEVDLLSSFPSLSTDLLVGLFDWEKDRLLGASGCCWGFDPKPTKLRTFFMGPDVGASSALSTLPVRSRASSHGHAFCNFMKFFKLPPSQTITLSN